MALFSFIFNSDIAKGPLLYFLWGSGNWAQGFRNAQRILSLACVPWVNSDNAILKGGFLFVIHYYCWLIVLRVWVHFDWSESYWNSFLECSWWNGGGWVSLLSFLYGWCRLELSGLGFALTNACELRFSFLASQFWFNRYFWLGQRIYTPATLLGSYTISR